MRAGLVPFLLLVGCQATSVLPSPGVPEGAQAGLLVVLGGEGSTSPNGWPTDGVQRVLEAHAVDLGSANWPALRLDEVEEVRALTFGCPLDGLGLPPGPLSPGPVVADRAPPSPLSHGSLEVGAAPPRWSDVGVGPIEDPLRIAFQSLPFVDGALCSTLGPTLTPLGPVAVDTGTAAPTFAVPLRDGGALVGTEAGLLQIRSNGRAERYPGPGGIIRAGWGRDDGAVWLLDSRGQLYLGRLGQGWAPIGPIAPLNGASYAALAGPSGDEPEGLWLVTSNRVLAHFNGQTWTTIQSTPPRPWRLGGLDVKQFPLRLVRLGPEHYLTFGVTESNSEVFEWDHGLTRTSSVPIRNGIIYSLAASPIHGWIVAGPGGLWFNRGGAWQFEAGPRLPIATVVYPDGGGLLLAGVRRIYPRQIRLSPYHPDAPSCDEIVLQQPLLWIVPLDQDALLLVGAKLGEDAEFLGTELQITTQTRPFAPRCSAENPGPAP